MAQTVFNRVEKKFLLNEKQYLQMRKALEPYMEVDEYGEHTIRNIYYDTFNDELVRTSIEKPVYKEKFRIRSYGVPKEGSDVFLEIKKKYDGVVNKRRITLSPEEARSYLKDGVVPKNIKQSQEQIFKEINYFVAYYKILPKMYLAYDRIALFGKEDAEFRVTFDRNIRYRNDSLTLDIDEGNEYLLPEGSRIMEVKITNAMPRWFVDILSEYEIRMSSFSKYGTAYGRNLTAGMYDYVQAKPKQVTPYRQPEHYVCAAV